MLEDDTSIKCSLVAHVAVIQILLGFNKNCLQPLESGMNKGDGGKKKSME